MSTPSTATWVSFCAHAATKAARSSEGGCEGGTPAPALVSTTGSEWSAAPSRRACSASGVRPAAPAESGAASSWASSAKAFAFKASRAAFADATALETLRGNSAVSGLSSSSSASSSAAACTMSVMSGTALSDLAIAFFHRAAASGSFIKAFLHLASATLGALWKLIASSRFAASNGSSMWPASDSFLFSDARSLRYLALSASLSESPLSVSPSRLRFPEPSWLKTLRAIASASALATPFRFLDSSPVPLWRPSCGAYLAAELGSSPSARLASCCSCSAKHSQMESVRKGKPGRVFPSASNSSSASKARSFHDPYSGTSGNTRATAAGSWTATARRIVRSRRRSPAPMPAACDCAWFRRLNAIRMPSTR
mmetsp:Transcript_22372/g.51514  ORF Transcript_22372/g.51514 Transcript_22372/m.51514 type:complete len:369 (-) Transcript_22372:251-1357(-)